MRPTVQPLIGVLILAAIAAACASPGPSPTPTIILPTVVPVTPRPARTLGPNEYWLPVLPGLVLGPDASPMPCAGIGIGHEDGSPVALHGSATDPLHAWLGDGAGRLSLVWPAGYAARFNPKLEVLDEAGHVVARDGQTFDGVCVTGSETYWLPLH